MLEKELNALNRLKEKNQQLIKQNEKLRADLTKSGASSKIASTIESAGEDLELQDQTPKQNN